MTQLVKDALRSKEECPDVIVNIINSYNAKFKELWEQAFLKHQSYSQSIKQNLQRKLNKICGNQLKIK